MKDSGKLRRQLYILRLLGKPHTYPSLPKLSDHLRENDFNHVSDATVERDIRDIRNEYALTITFDRRERGYYLDLPTEADVDEFNEYIRLLERRERLETLTYSGRGIGKYLQMEHHDGGASSQFRGLDWLATIWEALQRRLVIRFRYHAYGDTNPVDQWRFVEPGLLVEHRNRWYLDGYELEKGVRTFGLDRINELTLTTQAIDPVRNSGLNQIDYRAARQHVIGITAPPDAPVERVVLRFAKTQIDYVKSLPLHSSQIILDESPTHLDIALNVILNPELEILILGYGEQVEVLEPMVLREKIARRVKTMCYTYTVSEKQL